MKTKVRRPDGTVIVVEHPEDATEEQILAFAKKNFDTPAESPTQPAESPTQVTSPVQAQPVVEVQPEQNFPLFKETLRETVQSRPGLQQFITEITPSLVGASAGVKMGAPLGPLGIMAGGGIGGILGEFFAQETGIAPESDLALAVTGAAPVLGPVVGGGLKLLRRGIGKAATSLPPAAAATARTTTVKAAAELESLGTKILARQKGLLKESADRLFAAAKIKAVPIPSDQLRNTSRVLATVDQELQKISSFPEGQQAIGLIDKLTGLVQKGSITFDEFIAQSQLVGSAVKKAERAAGVRLGSAKRLFSAMREDLTQIARGAKAKGASREVIQRGKQAKIALAANARAKLEFSIKDFEAAVARFTTDVPGSTDKAINVAKFQEWLSNVTNPKSSQFDKNLTEGLKDFLPEIKSRLSTLAKLTERSGSPAGPGSIVVRGIGSRTGRAILGAVLGGSTGDPLIAGAGSLLGASTPEIFTGLLASKRGSQLLERAARLGKGSLPVERWANLAQFVTRAAQVDLQETSYDRSSPRAELPPIR